MGVDVECYRARIGTFSPRRKGDRQSETSSNGETRGSVSFIKILLVAHGIHPNPGPLFFGMNIPPVICWIGGAFIIVVVIGTCIWGATYIYYKFYKNDATDNNKDQNYPWQQTQETFKDKEIKKLHARMINDLTGYLRPGDNDNWRNFIALMEGHLGSLNRNDIKHVNDIFNMLEAKGIISYGYYDEIYEDLRRIHVDAVKILQQTAAKIQRIRNEGKADQDVDNMRRNSQLAERQFACVQSGDMAGVPRLSAMQGTDCDATFQEENRISGEEYKKLNETLSKLIQRENEQNQRINDLEDGQKALKARIITLETERATEEQDDEIPPGRAPNRSAMVVGSTEVIKGSMNIPDFKRIDK